MDLINDLSKEYHTPALDSVCRNISHIGAYPILGLLIIFVVGLLALQKEYQKAAVVVAFIFTSTMIIESIKIFIFKERPPDPNAVIYTPMTMTVLLILGQAINIGHRRYILGYGIMVGILVGVCKIFIGVQYVNAIITGWVVGLIFGITYGYINEKLEKWHNHEVLIR